MRCGRLRVWLGEFGWAFDKLAADQRWEHVSGANPDSKGVPCDAGLEGLLHPRLRQG
jgi:hypothetical protein